MGVFQLPVHQFELVLLPTQQKKIFKNWKKNTPPKKYLSISLLLKIVFTSLLGLPLG